MSLYTSDGEVVYVDHPESVLVSAAVIAIDPGSPEPDGVAQDLIFLNPDQLVRIQHTTRKPLRRFARAK